MVEIRVLAAGIIPGHHTAFVGDIIKVPGELALASVIMGYAERID